MKSLLILIIIFIPAIGSSQPYNDAAFVVYDNVEPASVSQNEFSDYTLYFTTFEIAAHPEKSTGHKKVRISANLMTENDEYFSEKNVVEFSAVFNNGSFQPIGTTFCPYYKELIDKLTAEDSPALKIKNGIFMEFDVDNATEYHIMVADSVNVRSYLKDVKIMYYNE